MPFDDAAEAKCADSESEDEYVESRLERVLREEAGEAKPEAPRYTQLDDELLSDMQRGDEQMRRLVRHRLNKQREAADEKVCRQLLRKERFERGMRKGCIDHDEKLAALAAEGLPPAVNGSGGGGSGGGVDAAVDRRELLDALVRKLYERRGDVQRASRLIALEALDQAAQRLARA